MTGGRSENDFAVIADDLTGAVDISAQFNRLGYKTLVLTDANKAKEISMDADILVINTQSREKTRSEAYKGTADALRFLRGFGVKRVFLKIDTAFRGNPAESILALLDGMKPRIALVAPAIPSMERITVGGYQLFGQTPIERTDYSKDPICPVNESSIPTLLANQTGRKVKHVELSLILKEYASLGLQRALEERANIVVADAVSQEDLNHVAESAYKIGVLDLTVGSLGFAQAVVRTLKPRRTACAVPPRSLPERPVLIVSGTYHPQTTMQIEHITRLEDIPIIDLDTTELCRNQFVQVKLVSDSVAGYLSSGKDIVMRTASNIDDVNRSLAAAQKEGISQRELYALVRKSVGEIVRNVIKHTNTSCTIATGGDTSFAVCTALGASGLRVVKQIDLAVVHSLCIGGDFDGLSLITKGGSVGDKDVFMNILDYVDGLNIENGKEEKLHGRSG